MCWRFSSMINSSSPLVIFSVSGLFGRVGLGDFGMDCRIRQFGPLPIKSLSTVRKWVQLIHSGFTITTAHLPHHFVSPSPRLWSLLSEAHTSTLALLCPRRWSQRTMYRRSGTRPNITDNANAQPLRRRRWCRSPLPWALPVNERDAVALTAFDPQRRKAESSINESEKKKRSLLNVC